MIILVAATCIVASAFPLDDAAKEEKPIVVTACSGLYYNATPLPSDALGMFFGFLFNLRGEANGGIHFRISDRYLVGLEAGFAAISVDFTGSSSESSFVLFDIPVRIVGSVDLSVITLQPYLGGILLMYVTTPADASSSFKCSPAFEAGVQILLGRMSGLYLEAGHVLGSSIFPRFGLGFQVEL